MKTFLVKNGVLVVPSHGMSYFQSNEGDFFFFRFADPKEAKFLSENCSRVQFEAEPEALENPQDLLWQYVARCRAEETEEFPCEDFRVFTRKWGGKLLFLKVEDKNPTNPNDSRSHAHLKLYGVEGDYRTIVWTGPTRFNDFFDDDFIAIEEVGESLESVSLDWFWRFGPATKLEAGKNLEKILGRKPKSDEVFSRPMNRRRK